jgi:hypothetical protein
MFGLFKIAFVIMLCIGTISSVSAQTTPVPDVTGGSVALAASRLNAAGFALGTETSQLWSPSLNIAPGTVIAQAVEPGTALAAGSAVEITVLRPANIVAVYDDNELTLLNQSSSAIDLTPIALNSLDGDSASFPATRWASTLEPGECVQVWAIVVNSPKPIEGCQSIRWLTTNNTAEHFWTTQGGTTQFAIVEGGILRAICAVGTSGRCELYVGSSGGVDETTPFVHFAYTESWFVVRNTSENQWMSLQNFPLFNYNVPQPGLSVPLADPTIYSYINPLGRIDRLAPGQCLLFYAVDLSQVLGELPDCHVMGSLQLDPATYFWGAAFEMNSQSDGQRRTCPAATPNRVTLCIMPR